MNWLEIGDEGLVDCNRIIAVGWAEAAPIRRLIQARTPEQVLVLTGGRKRQSALILDSGHIIVTPLTVSELAQLLKMRSMPEKFLKF